MRRERAVSFLKPRKIKIESQMENYTTVRCLEEKPSAVPSVTTFIVKNHQHQLNYVKYVYSGNIHYVQIHDYC